MANLKNTTIDDTGFIKLPVGTTGQRPSSPQAGMLRFNTDIDTLEDFGSATWKRYINNQEIENSVSQANNYNDAVSFIGDGAIVESDSNSDGRYTRWSDGTQIVSNVDTGVSSTSSNFTFISSATQTNGDGIFSGRAVSYPKSFNSAPIVLNNLTNPGSRGSSSSGEIVAPTVHERNSTGCFLRYLDLTGGSSSFYPTYIAIGEWS